MLKSGDIIAFDDVGGRYNQATNDSGLRRQIIGFDKSGTAQTIDISRVLEVECKQSEGDPGGTIITVLLIGGVALFFLILLAYSGWH
ncbi:MAG: hypothetical protein ABI778_07080 [Ignavibacteriota bacterium]